MSGPNPANILIVSGLVLALCAPVAMARGMDPPSRFDLDCAMTHMLKRPRGAGRVHLRVDLDSQRWCEDRCEAVQSLKLGDEQVELSVAAAPMGPATVNRTLTLNRKSGRLRDERQVTLNGDVVSVDLFVGDCRLRRYSDVDRKLF